MTAEDVFEGDRSALRPRDGVVAEMGITEELRDVGARSRDIPHALVVQTIEDVLWLFGSGD